MTRRTRKTLLIVLTVLVLLALAIFLRSKAPPEAARLLPESDGILYANLRPIRAFLHKNGELSPAPPRDPEYQQFIAATNIDWERDLDEAAIAIHKMPNPNGPNGPVAYSMVLVGTLNGKTLAAYLESHGAQKETYAGHTIYSLPSEGRTVRICQIGYDMVAISNTPSTEQIHSIIDRHRSAALPFSGSTLLIHHFSEVPLLSLAWGVGQIGLPFSESGKIHILGLELPIPADTTLVVSARWAGSIHLRLDADTPDPATALNQASEIATLLSLARTVTPQLTQDTTPAGQANNALLQILSTAQVEAHKEKLTATASIDPSKLK
jgi:hypothetical protein